MDEKKKQRLICRMYREIQNLDQNFWNPDIVAKLPPLWKLQDDPCIEALLMSTHNIFVYLMPSLQKPELCSYINVYQLR